MTNARRQRLKEAKAWYAAQSFTEDSHVVKAYRKRFNVDKTCAMRELCMLNVLSPKKQKAYRDQLRAKAAKRAARKEIPDLNPDQDAYFFYIAGYTSGGAPYGITWEEEREQGLLDEDNDAPDSELPF